MTFRNENNYLNSDSDSDSEADNGSRINCYIFPSDDDSDMEELAAAAREYPKQPLLNVIEDAREIISNTTILAYDIKALKLLLKSATNKEDKYEIVGYILTASRQILWHKPLKDVVINCQKQENENNLQNNNNNNNNNRK